MDISIIIINFKTPELIKSLISSIIEKTTECTYEIIIVDNSDNQKDFALLLSALASFVNIRIVRSDGNVGFSKANNAGARLAIGNFLLFLNSDTLLFNNAIDLLFSEISHKNNIGVIGPNLYTSELKPAFSFERKPTSIKEYVWSRSFVSAVKRKIYKGLNFNTQRKTIVVNGFITGACLMISKRLFDNIGGFDERIFMYSEDNLLCTKARKMGYLLISDPFAKVIHFGGKSDAKIWSSFKVTNYVHGHYIYFFDTYGQKYALKFLLSASKINKALYKRTFKKDPNLLNLSNAYLKEYQNEMKKQ